jgi:alpha-1,3-rhamnosyl/mannosyltransferase
MRVCIDAVPLLVPSAGVKSYLYHWILSLRNLYGSQLKLFPFLRKFGPLDHQHSVCGPGSTLARLAYLNLLNLRDNAVLDWVGPKVDVFHATKLLYPPKKCRLTATLHDATCWILPEMHTAANVKADKQFAAKVLSRADGLIAVSRHTRSDAIQVMGLNPDRIEVIYPGVPDAYFQADSESARSARQKFGLTRDYILFEGTIEPRKNLGRLLDAYASLPQSLREEFSLVIAGFPGWANEELLKRIASKPPGVRYLGYVPEPWVPGLFAGATIFAFPSLYEGFGLPLVQAMAAGVATITSHVSALPEVAGDAAELIDPLNTAELAAALAKLLTSPGLRTKLSVSGRKRVEQYRWDRCALQTSQYFEKIAGRV